MMDILADEARPVLEDVARRRMLLAFDFDGTLAPQRPDYPVCLPRPTTGVGTRSLR